MVDKRLILNKLSELDKYIKQLRKYEDAEVDTGIIVKVLNSLDDFERFARYINDYLE